MLAARDEASKAFAQPDLRLPADVLNRLGQPVDAALNVLRDLGGMPIRPRAFDQGAPGAAVARFGHAALATRRAARILGGNQADERGQLSRRIEAREVAEFGDDGDRDEELDAAQRVQRLHDGREAPRRRALEEFRFESLEPIDLFIGRQGLELVGNIARMDS